MKCVVLSLFVLAASIAGCSRPYVYTSYEVVRVIGDLHPGDQIRVVAADGSETRGEIVGIDAPRVTLTTADGTRVSVNWEETRIVERVKRTRATAD